MNKYLREPINGLTHLTGAILSLIGLIIMLVKVGYSEGTGLQYVCAILFGISMILLYSASATYHSVIADSHIIKRLKKLDHSMIFVLITGSYAPFCLLSLNNSIGLKLFILIGILAIVGIIFKLFWVTCPRWLSSFMYIAMGWLVIFAIYPLSKVLSFGGILLLVLGGVLYTVGGVIYALKENTIRIGLFGCHEIFHIFIMLGSLCHFFCVLFYVL